MVKNRCNVMKKCIYMYLYFNGIFSGYNGL